MQSEWACWLGLVDEFRTPLESGVIQNPPLSKRRGYPEAGAKPPSGPRVDGDEADEVA